MKKITNKFLAILLCMIMLLSCIGTISFAEENTGSSSAGTLTASDTSEQTVGADAKKVYIKLKTPDAAGDKWTFKFYTTADSKNTLKVYGVTDASACNWNSSTITYENAPANDRLSNGVNLNMVYGGTELATVAVNGAAVHTVDITDYVNSMVGVSEYCTLIFTLDRVSEGIEFTENFDSATTLQDATHTIKDEAAQYVRATYSIGSDMNYSNDARGSLGITLANNEQGVAFAVPSNVVESMTSDISEAKELTISYWYNTPAQVNLGLNTFNGRFKDGGPEWVTYSNKVSTNQWQQITHTYTISTTQLQNMKNGTQLSFGILMGATSTTGTIYIDDIEIKVGNVSYKEDFDGAMTLKDATNAIKNEAAQYVRAAYSSSTEKDHTRRSLGITLANNEQGVAFVVPSNVVESMTSDISEAKELTISYWYNTPAQVNLGLNTFNGRFKDGGPEWVTYSNKVSTNQWQQITHTYTISTTQLQNMKNGTQLSFGILMGATSTTGTIYIDNIQIKEAAKTPVTIVPSPLYMKENFEGTTTLEQVAFSTSAPITSVAESTLSLISGKGLSVEIPSSGEVIGGLKLPSSVISELTKDTTTAKTITISFNYNKPAAEGGSKYPAVGANLYIGSSRAASTRSLDGGASSAPGGSGWIWNGNKTAKVVDTYTLTTTDLENIKNGATLAWEYRIHKNSYPDSGNVYFDEIVIKEVPSSTDATLLPVADCVALQGNGNKSVTELTVNAAAPNAFFTDEIGTLKGHTLSLAGDIAVNFWMDINDAYANSETAYMQFTVPDDENDVEIVKIPLKDGVDGTGDLEGYKCYTAHVAAKEMTDVIKAQLYKDSDTPDGSIYTYSVREYAETIMKHNYSDRTKELVKAMLNYGAYAQTYFEYNTNNLANVGYAYTNELDYVTASAVKDACEAITNKGSEDVALERVSLILESETALKMYFNVKTGVTPTFSVNDTVVEAGTQGTYATVKIPNIAAGQLGNNQTVTITYGDNTNATAEYNCLAYCYSVLMSNQAEALNNLVKALYLYDAAAIAYVTPWSDVDYLLATEQWDLETEVWRGTKPTISDGVLKMTDGNSVQFNWMKVAGIGEYDPNKTYTFELDGWLTDAGDGTYLNNNSAMTRILCLSMGGQDLVQAKTQDSDGNEGGRIRVGSDESFGTWEGLSKWGSLLNQKVHIKVELQGTTVTTTATVSSITKTGISTVDASNMESLVLRCEDGAFKADNFTFTDGTTSYSCNFTAGETYGMTEN